MSNSLEERARELREELDTIDELCGPRHPDDVTSVFMRVNNKLAKVQEEARLAALEEAAAYVDDWHSEVDSPFAGDCIRAHFALAQAAPPALKGTKCSCIEQVRTAASMQPDAAVRRIILAIADGLEAAAPATKEG